MASVELVESLVLEDLQPFQGEPNDLQDFRGVEHYDGGEVDRAEVAREDANGYWMVLHVFLA